MLRYEDRPGGAIPVIASGELTVENTTYCGAHCVMCPRDEYQYKWSHMAFELFQDVIRQGVELGLKSLDICGFGDPLMDPGLGKKLAFVKETYPDIRIYTSTTAHLLARERLEWVCEYLDTLKISNYGFSKASYEAIHGGTVKFETVWENVHNLLARPRGRRPYVMLSFLVFPENRHEIEDWKAYWHGRADEIMVWLPHNYGGAQQISDRAYLTEARVEHEAPRSCGRPVRGNPFIRFNGDVSVCCFDFNHKLVVGNLQRTPLLQILGGPKLGRVKDVHERLAFDGCGLLCEGCDQIFDRSDALLYSSTGKRKVDQPTTHPDHVVRLVQEMVSGQSDCR
jgi:Iron-sulfur cluster-binding domain